MLLLAQTTSLRKLAVQSPEQITTKLNMNKSEICCQKNGLLASVTANTKQ
jgi:hypothetical protein